MTTNTDAPAALDLCSSCGTRPAGHGHFALYCEPCSDLPYGDAAPAAAPAAPAHTDHLPGFVLCARCSTRSTPVMVHRNDKRAHDAVWHTSSCCPDLAADHEGPHSLAGQRAL